MSKNQNQYPWSVESSSRAVHHDLCPLLSGLISSSSVLDEEDGDDDDGGDALAALNVDELLRSDPILSTD